MSVLFVLIFVAIIMAGAFLVSFIWAVKNGQYEDTYTPSVRILFDDMLTKDKKIKENSNPTSVTNDKEKVDSIA
jgi:cbb3-type cytochrome oxidase maturation protein